jgi:hypothetical protein
MIPSNLDEFRELYFTRLVLLTFVLVFFGLTLLVLNQSPVTSIFLGIMFHPLPLPPILASLLMSALLVLLPAFLVKNPQYSVRAVAVLLAYILLVFSYDVGTSGGGAVTLLVFRSMPAIPTVFLCWLMMMLFRSMHERMSIVTIRGIILGELFVGVGIVWLATQNIQVLSGDEEYPGFIPILFDPMWEETFY